MITIKINNATHRRERAARDRRRRDAVVTQGQPHLGRRRRQHPARVLGVGNAVGVARPGCPRRSELTPHATGGIAGGAGGTLPELFSRREGNFYRRPDFFTGDTTHPAAPPPSSLS